MQDNWNIDIDSHRQRNNHYQIHAPKIINEHSKTSFTSYKKENLKQKKRKKKPEDYQNPQRRKLQMTRAQVSDSCKVWSFVFQMTWIVSTLLGQIPAMIGHCSLVIKSHLSSWQWISIFFCIDVSIKKTIKQPSENPHKCS